MTVQAWEANYLTEEEYLAMEAQSPMRHEYLGGVVYAMGGGTLSHDILLNNLTSLLATQLRGTGCRAFGSDFALRLPAEIIDSTYYYYPDKMISCDAAHRRPLWMEKPTVIFEILSDSTRQTDEREKRAAYLRLESLQVYVRLEQHVAAAVVEYRTPEGWRQMQVEGLEAAIALSTPTISLPMRELYQDVPLEANPSVN